MQKVASEAVESSTTSGPETGTTVGGGWRWMEDAWDRERHANIFGERGELGGAEG